MGQFPHNFTITDLGVATDTVQPGQQTTVQFTPTAIGQFGFLCTHTADKGMTGTLIVQ